MAKVLVIDDEKTIGTLMSRVIERMGHMVEYAETIKTDMEAVQEDNFDIIFLDEVGELSFGLIFWNASKL